jgi:CheY-like chemotaxis protein
MFGKNALVIDDSRTARTVLKHQLNQFDVIVESASDGSHALELLRSHVPDVIFLDHVMPGLDGFQVLQLLKKNQFTKGIPVVMYTSQAAPQYTREAISLGAIAVIPKKVTDEQLMEALDKAELYHLREVNDDEATATDADAPLAAELGKAERYHIRKVQPDQTTAANSDDAANSSFGDTTAKETAAARWSRSDSAATQRARHSDVAVDQPEKISAPEARVNSDRVGVTSPVNSQEIPSSMRGWLVALLLAVLVIVQGNGIIRDREQQQVISDLRQRVMQQEQQIPQIQAQLSSEQSDHIRATWTQVEFLMNILMDHLQQHEIEIENERAIDIANRNAIESGSNLDSVSEMESGSEVESGTEIDDGSEIESEEAGE